MISGDVKKKEDWIDEENLRTRAGSIRSRIKETARKAETDFWEIVLGSYPEIPARRLPSETSPEFGRVCREAVIGWYIANAELDERIIDLLRSTR